MIGNSRLHWAEFADDKLQRRWDTPHLSDRPAIAAPELWIASVVPGQSVFWHGHPAVYWIDRTQIPLQGLYPSLGLDRALAVWGALKTIGNPVLVIDGGTALTLTGAAGDRLVGGAILPGLGLQRQALHQSTAALPLVDWPATLPPRWATNTPDAIASGILHTAIAGLRDFISNWQQQFPSSAIVLTGGDGARLHELLQQAMPVVAQMVLEPAVIHWGMSAVRAQSQA